MTKIDEMIDFCNREKIYFFCDLVNYASKNRKDWFRTLITESGTRTMVLYLAERAYHAGIISREEYEAECEDMLDGMD